MAKSSTAKATTATDLFSKYMNYVLENEQEPISIFKFCKSENISEADFYTHFGSFDGLKEQIWVAFFDQTHNLLEKDEHFSSYPNKEKMLSLFFTLFEVFTANRSYILFTLKTQEYSLKHLKQLSGLRHKIRHFANDLITVSNEEKTYRLTKKPVQLFSEGAWVQFLFLLKYWMNDNSAGFEKTDMAIEKSVKVIFDVFENTPLDSIIDFGKFLIQENFAFAKAK